MKLFLSIILIFTFLFTGNIFSQEAPAKTENVKYTCPMHPEIQEDKEGKCPKCGMNLILDKKESKKTGSDEEEDESDDDHCAKCKEKKSGKKKEPSKCDKCKEKMDSDETDEKPAKKEVSSKVKGSYYTCSMHPEIKKDKPGKCPKCGMKLILHKDKKKKKK